jgi:bifunctional non-homologous end joining protein LigD
VLDGEVVALDAQGRLDFEALQRRMRARAGVRAGRRPVAYLFFDLLWLDGRLLCPAPYAERRRLLDGLGLAGPAWQPVASFPGEGPRCWPPRARRGWRASSPSASTAPTCPAARRRLAERLAAMRVEASPFLEDPAAAGGGRAARSRRRCSCGPS